MTIDIVYLADHIQHVAELSRLHQAEWGHLSPQIDLETRVTRLTEAAGKSGVPTIFIAVEGPGLIGSAALVKSDMRERPELSPWLAAVYVKPERRRNGIASALIARVETEATSLGVEKLYLVTEHQEQFYEHRGWDWMEHADHDGIPVAIMKKRLFAGEIGG